MMRELIFDIGMHRGLDTEYYLRKGFRVVAVEANPELVSAVTTRCAQYIEAGRLKIIDKAIWRTKGEMINFFVNPVKDDWSSITKGRAEQGGHSSVEISVETITLSDLYDCFGVPYYVKCDIEGADEIVAAQLAKEERQPAFVSIEAVSVEAVTGLFSAGFDRFQIVNQAFAGHVVAPKTPLEGKYVDQKFNGHMSGLFGLELDRARFLTFHEMMERYIAFISLKKLDPTLAFGWLDIHATKAQTLSRAERLAY